MAVSLPILSRYSTFKKEIATTTCNSTREPQGKGSETRKVIALNGGVIGGTVTKQGIGIARYIRLGPCDVTIKE